MPSARPSWMASVVLATTMVLLPGQDQAKRLPSTAPPSRIEQLVTRSVAKLGDDATRADALVRLENLGKLALPGLLARLHWRQRNDLSRQQQADLLYLVGRLGPDGLPALDEIRAWIHEDDRALAQQLLDTISMLAPYMTKKQAASLRDDMRRLIRSGPLRDYDIVRSQLHLAGKDPAVVIRRYLDAQRSSDAWFIAICRWLVADRTRLRRLPVTFTDWVRIRLEQETERRRITFERTPTRSEGDLAELWLMMTQAPLDAHTARALLNHRDARHRLRAVHWLAENGGNLPAEQRADLVGRLWDPEDNVTATAARALGGHGVQGLLGAPALARMAARHTSAEVRQACQAALASIEAALASLPQDDRIWVSAALAIVAGREGQPGDARPGPRGHQAIAELLLMAQWGLPDHTAQLLALVERGQPTADEAASVYTWCRHADHAIVDQALSFLARNRGQVPAAVRAHANGDIREETTWLAARWVTRASQGAAFEANAWFMTWNLNGEQLAELTESLNTRLVARALAELITAHPAQLRALERQLRELCDLAEDQPLQWRATSNHNWSATTFQLAEPVRVLAAIGLARHGIVLEDRNGLDARVRAHCGVPLAELPRLVAKAVSDSTLAGVVDGLERACRRRLYVPEQLVWPRLARL